MQCVCQLANRPATVKRHDGSTEHSTSYVMFQFIMWIIGLYAKFFVCYEFLFHCPGH